MEQLRLEYSNILQNSSLWFTDNIINSFFYILSKNIRNIEFSHTFITAGSQNNKNRFLGIDQLDNFSQIYPVNFGNHWICIHFYKEGNNQQLDWFDPSTLKNRKDLLKTPIIKLSKCWEV